MLFKEYKSTFEEILSLTVKIEELCMSNKVDEIAEPFAKRDALFKKLSLPDDIPDNQLDYINNLSEQIQKKNENILRYFKVTKNEIKKELISLNSEDKILDAYKVPIDTNSKIFDSLE